MDISLRRPLNTSMKVFEPGRTLNKVGTRQSAYNKIDVNQPYGDWIEEPAYNRSQRTHGVLDGNWLEERRLQEEKKQLEELGLIKTVIDEREKKYKPSSTVVFHTDYTGSRTGFFLEREGHTTSKKNEHSYISAHSGMPPNAQDLETTHRETYKAPIRIPKSVGVREQVIEKELLMQALDQKVCEIVQQDLEQQEAEKEAFNSTYILCHCNGKKSIFKGEEPISSHASTDNSEKYYKDIPITIYTEDVKKKKGHLTTNSFGKNTDFSVPISEYMKKATKE
jgi:hypothetical protein